VRGRGLEDALADLRKARGCLYKALTEHVSQQAQTLQNEPDTKKYITVTFQIQERFIRAYKKNVIGSP